MDVFTDDALGLWCGPGDVARDLRIMVRDAAGAKAEGRGIGVARLYLKAGPVDGTAVKTRRSASLQIRPLRNVPVVMMTA